MASSIINLIIALQKYKGGETDNISIMDATFLNNRVNVRAKENDEMEKLENVLESEERKRQTTEEHLAAVKQVRLPQCYPSSLTYVVGVIVPCLSSGMVNSRVYLL